MKVRSNEQIAAGAVTAYQDDFTADGDNQPTTLKNPADTSHLYDFLQPASDRDINRFADAYIQPVLITLNYYDNEIASFPHIQPTSLAVAKVVDDDRGSFGDEADLFWVVYVSTAYEGPKNADHDPDLGNFIAGGTRRENDISLVFVETTRDRFAALAPFATQMKAPNEDIYRARVTVHEVGHQFFDISDFPEPLHPQPEHRNSPKNLMSSEGFDAIPEERFQFFPLEINTLRRRLRSPET